MPRYIDADAFDADCRKRYCTDCDNYNGVKCRACWVDDMLGDVDDAPTISPDDVRGAGMWIKLDAHKGMEQYKCSACNNPMYVPECMGKPMYSICPVCGAKMEVEGDA